ncbi:hypothetical protein BPT24_069 [Tenacibaculum phage pT24]|uniref:Uncharacterized protein n=1 Tax=Tenacibaculum phage pT24 TaxID=1880590 RepID=A0A1B4XWK9_9CAUD|nr:hypothetical protein HYP10_gp069 [Tenacibaculum phage pT24]BAV39192.1 hypothetical protein BPT24_069 [Tenacibaculum phage pT24]
MKNQIQNPDNKILLVVGNENTLGYIFPQKPNIFNVLSASVLRGSTMCENVGFYDIDIHKINYRLANEKDFDTYRTSTTGFFNNDEYLHA